MEVQLVSGSITTTASGSAGTSAAVNLPSVTGSQRVLVALASNNATATHSTPTGWTLITSVTDTNIRLSYYYNSASTLPTFTSTLSASVDWAAIAVAFDGAFARGFVTLGFISDITHSSTHTASSATTTHTAATSLMNGYSSAGRCRVVFGAYASASAGGFTAASFGGTAAGDLTNVSSSGATPVRLGMAIEAAQSSVTAVAPSMTSAVSTADLVMVFLSLRPKTRQAVTYTTTTAVSSSAGTAVTQPAAVFANTTVFMSCVNNGAQAFNWPSPWQLVDSVTTGSLRHEIWMLCARSTSSTDFPVTTTLGGSCDWALSLSYFIGAVRSSTVSDVVRSSQMVTDTTNDTALTTGTITNGTRGDLVLAISAAEGISQATGALSTTFTDTGLASVGTTATSSGSPRAMTTFSALRAPVADGATGTVTANFTVSSTEKSLWYGVIRSADAFDSAGILLG
jgi:hypothetical protein